MDDMFSQLSWKDQRFIMVPPATDEEMQIVLDYLQLLDVPFQSKSEVVADMLTSTEKLKEFVQHTCKFKTYSMSITKCGDPACTIAGCGPITMPQHLFDTLVHDIPDPTLRRNEDSSIYKNEDGNAEHIPFEDLHGKVQTTEADRPQLLNNPGASHEHGHSD